MLNPAERLLGAVPLSSSAKRTPFGKQGVRFLCAAALVLLSCNTDSNKRTEFARLNRAVELLQRASNKQKTPFVRGLENETCRFFCKFKDQCLLAYQTHDRALDLLSELRSELDSATDEREGATAGGRARPALSPAESAEAARKLAHAQSLLVLSRSQTKACAEQQGRLVRSWGR